MTTFFSFNALESQRSSGYKNTAYALAELIDNSFDADAVNVKIFLLEKRVSNRLKVEEIIICDDGKGMNSKLLQEALQFGRTTNADLQAVIRTKKKGKFGYGLPNASISQCTKIDVYSWQDSGNPNYVYFHLDELRRNQSIEIPPVQAKKLPTYYSEMIGELPESGTIVSWSECDRLSHVRGDTIISHSESILGQLYRHLLAAGKTITLYVFEHNSRNNQYVKQKTTKIRPNDPLFLMSNTLIGETLWKQSSKGGGTGVTAEYYSRFVSSPTECLPTSERLQDQCLTTTFRWRGNEYHFEITTSVAHIDIQKPGIRTGGDTNVGLAYRVKEERGNISFVRADREIASGVFGGFYNRTILPARFWSIEVKFNPDSDDLLGLANNKQSIEFTLTNKDSEEFDEHVAELVQARIHCWKHLTQIIADCISEASKTVKRQAKQWDDSHVTPGGSVSKTPGVPVSTPTTTSTIKKVDGARDRTLSDENLKILEKRLVEKYSSIDPTVIRSAIENLDKSLTRACVLYAPTESRQLWTYTRVYDFLVVLVNSSHEFYVKGLSELRNNGQEGALTVIELFLSSLAVEEDTFAGNPEHKTVIEDFRESVGSKLHRYIKELPQEITARYISQDYGEDDDA